MADPANQEAPARSQEGQQPSGDTSGGAIGLTMAYITSIPGILKIVEFFTLMIAFAVGADSTSYTWGRRDFFLFVTVTSWIVVMVVFLLFAFNVIAKINLNIDLNIPVFTFAATAALFLLISSSLIADNAREFEPVWSITLPSSLGKLRAAAAFGFISMFVFIGDAVVHFKKMQENARMNMQT